MKEKRNQKSLRRNGKPNSKTIFAIVAVTFIATAIFSITKADAAYAGSYNDIGSYDDIVGGKSINGVRISKNSEILNYALDMWEKNSNNEWKYTGSNIDGYVDDIESSVNNSVFIKGKSEPRFGINISNIKNRLPQNGSIVVRKYKKEKLIYERAEFTYQIGNENKIEDSVSLLKQIAKGVSKLELPSTNYSFDGVSYIYDIYDAAVIGQSGDIYTALDDCRIISEGYAYYGIEGEYIIKELPIVEHNKMDGYTYNFDGWYTQEGYKVHIGDAIDLKSTIYPRWDISHISYNVNYIDILGDQPDGKVLGTSTETLYCNDEANGSDMGSDESAGAYYKGLYYTGCTSEIVQGDCDVYRYFRPALYNIVFNGNMAVSGETAPLNNCVYDEAYKLTENGFKRNGIITLDLNAEDAMCATKSINVAYEFKGWSDTVNGNTVYIDCESVSNLCEADGEKQLYAVWDGGSVETVVIPEREGFHFDGWSKDKSATSGNTWFDVSDGNECTLYAVWIKKQDDTDNVGNGDNNIDDNTGDTGGTVTGGSIDSGNSEDNGNNENDNSGNTGSSGSENTGGNINTDIGNESDNNTDSINSGSSENNKNNGDSNITDTENGSENNIDSGSQNTGNNAVGTDKENSNSNNNNSNNINNNDAGTGNNSNINNISTENKGNSNNAGSNINKGNSGNTTSGSSISNGSTSTSGNKNNENKSPTSEKQNTDNESINTGNNNNSSTNINNDSTTSGSSNITQKTDINTSNKKENKKDETPQNKVVYPKVGKKYTKFGIIYKIIKSNSKKRTVKVIKATKNITKAKIPGSIKIKGHKYKVISIGKKAFIKCSKLKKVLIGKNIKSIGKKAFYKDRALANVTIKSRTLKSIGKDAFKRIKPKCTVKIAGSKKYSKKVFEMMNT